jgi:hypothetical protein
MRGDSALDGGAMKAATEKDRVEFVRAYTKIVGCTVRTASEVFDNLVGKSPHELAIDVATILQRVFGGRQ